MLKILAYIFGAVLVAIGVLGFVPVLTPHGMLFGVFGVNVLLNIINLVAGLVFLTAAAGVVEQLTPKLFFQIFGVVYLVIGLLGLLPAAGPLLTTIANNLGNTVLHLVIGVISLLLGFDCFGWCEKKTPS